MTAIFLHQPHNFSHFNSIPKFCCAKNNLKKTNTKPILAELSEIFLRHKMNHDFGITMIHRHFDLMENEVLVEALTTNAGNKELVTLATPWKVNDQVTIFPSIEKYELQTANHVVVPQSWYFTQEGTLVPYEFLAASSAMPEPPKDFVEEVFGVLERHGLTGLLGLKRAGELRSTTSYEITLENSRMSITTFGHIPQEPQRDESLEMTKVFWCFDDEGNPIPSNCCHRCGYCGSCNR